MDIGRRARVALVLLAAGDSRRFHGNKLLSVLDGKPMYRHVADEIAAHAAEVFCRRIVVSQYPEILEALAAEGYEAVENRESRLGISHSIHLALARLDGTEDGVCFTVCDQPWLRGETVAALVDGWRQSGREMACLTCGGRDGNPAVFSRACIPELLALRGDVGGRRVMAARPDEVYRLEVADGRELTDIDERPQQK